MAALLVVLAGCDRISGKNNQMAFETKNTTNTTNSSPEADEANGEKSDLYKYKKYKKGRLRARPSPSPLGDAKLGEQRLGLGGARDGILYVPARYRADQPAPLALVLHGAGGSARHGLDLLLRLADETGSILVAPDSRGRTWDVLLDEYGPDVELIDKALALTFSRYAVDPERVAIGGFSDGASYALSLGIMNGELFRHVLAFSPGFAAPASQEGSPRIYISHGTRDAVLPIDRCSQRIVPRLKRAGYDVLYREFEGPHTVPQEIAREAVLWFLKRN
jgi:predicted esterase